MSKNREGLLFKVNRKRHILGTVPTTACHQERTIPVSSAIPGTTQETIQASTINRNGNGREKTILFEFL